eukprot:COSAG02_NODE_26_length_51927_cov_61.213881_1_plen_2607_part_00
MKEDSATAIRHAITAGVKVVTLYEGETDVGIRLGDGGTVVAVRPNSKAAAGGVTSSHVLVKVGSKTIRKGDTAALITKQVSTRPIHLTFKKPKADLTLRNLFLLENGAKTLTKAIPADNDYERLAVEKCSLGDDGIKVLVKQALAVPAKCRNLRGLYLCANSIGPRGAKSLASALKHLRELRTLRLDSNAVQCDGAKALFTALPETNLERIGLMNNQIADSGCNALAKVMTRCAALTSVNLQANMITDKACRKIMLALPKSSVDHLELSLNPITERGEKMVQRGRVSQARERKIRKTFETIDEDGSGELDKHEVAAMAAALGAPLVESMGSIHLSTRKLDEAFAQMDPNGDGAVSFSEFHEWYDKYVTDAPGVPEPGSDPQPEPDELPQPAAGTTSQHGSDDDAPHDATQVMVSRVWEYRRRATLPPSHYSKDTARKLQTELLEMKVEALTKRAQSLGVAEHMLEAAAAAESARAGSPRDTKGAIVDLIMSRDPFQDNLTGLVALLRDHGQHPRAACRCSREDVACSICLKAATIAEACCWALRLLVTEACASATADDVGIWLRCGALEVIHQTMENHPVAVLPDTPHDSVIQQNGCHAVQLVVEKLGPDAQAYACEVGYCETVVVALNGTKLAAVHERAAAALRALAKDCFVNKFRIGDIGGVEALVHSLKLHSTTPEIVTHTLWSLWHLCSPPEHPNIAEAHTLKDEEADLRKREVTRHKQWAASNHRRAVAAKAADAAASAKAKFPWVDSIQDGSIGLLGVIGEVPASASLGRARAVNVAQDHQLAEGFAKSLADAEQQMALEPDLAVAAPDPLPTISAMTVSAKLYNANVDEAESSDSAKTDDLSFQLKRIKGWGEGPMLLRSIIYEERCVAVLVDHENTRDHQETTEMLNTALLFDADIRKSQAKVNQETGAWLDRLGELGVVSYIGVRQKQQVVAEAKKKLQADFEEQKRNMLVRYMKRAGVDEDEAEWHDHQVKKIQQATRSRQKRKKSQKNQKEQKKKRAKPMTKDQKAALKKQKQRLKKEAEAARAEQVRIADEEAQKARNKASSRLRGAISKVAAKHQAARIKDNMKTNLAQLAQEQANETLKSLEAKLQDTQENMTLNLGSSQSGFPFEEPHWTDCCPLAPILPPLRSGDRVKVRVGEVVHAPERDKDSTFTAAVDSVAVEELEEGTVRKEDRYEPGNYFVKLEGVREPVKKQRNQLLQRLTREQYAEAEAKHLQAAALQALKNKQTAEFQYALELFSQVMDLAIPELTLSAALESLTTSSSEDGLVVQALEEAEKEARDEWMIELKEKELRMEHQRAELLSRKREQMIESYIWREGWENTQTNRLKAAQNAAAEKIQKMFQAKRSGVAYGLHNGDGTYKKKKKLVKKTEDGKITKAKAKLAKLDKAEAKLAKEKQEAAEAARRAEQEEREAKQAAEVYEKEQEEARIAQEKAVEEEEQARLAVEALAKEQEEARVAQVNADREMEDVQNAKAAVAQAEEDLQLAKDCDLPTSVIAEHQQKVDAAKAAYDKELAEYNQAQAHADAEKMEAVAAAKVAEQEAAEAAEAKLLADKETAEAEAARVVKEREEQEARLASERAANEAKDVKAQQKKVDKLNKTAKNYKVVLAQHEEEERHRQLMQDQADAKQLEEQAAMLKEQQAKLKADEDNRKEEQQKRRLEREAEELREREIRAFRQREQEKRRLIEQTRAEQQNAAAIVKLRWHEWVGTVIQQRTTRIVLEEADLKGVDLLKRELLAHKNLKTLMTEEIYDEVRQKMQQWLHENPDHPLTIFDVIGAWVYSMGPGKVEHGAAQEGADDWAVRHSFEIFPKFNESMRRVEVPNVADPKFRWLHYHLSNAVHHVPGVKQGQKLYRGQQKLYGDCIDDGQVFMWRDYKSTSTNEAAAKTFAGQDGYLFIISDCPHDFGASFCTPPGKQDLTAWPQESEILMPAGVTFRVMKKQKRRGLTTIDLSYVGEWMEEQDAPTRDTIMKSRKNAKATKRHQTSGMCSWLSSCMCGAGSGNEIQYLYDPQSPQPSPKTALDGDPSDLTPSSAPHTPSTAPESPQLPGAVPASFQTIKPQSKPPSRTRMIRRFDDVATMLVRHEQKTLRSELVSTHQMPEKVFSAVRQKMKDWAETNPNETISHRLPDLIAAWVFTMGRPAEPEQIQRAGMTRKDYNIAPWGLVTDIEVRNSFRIFETFNESMRSIDVPRKAEPEYKWMHYHMTNAIKHVKGAKKGQRLYRGQPELYGESYIEGAIVQWKDFKSTSTELQIASTFAGSTGFVFSIVEGVSANLGANFNDSQPPLSAWPEEKEILLPAGATFRVLKHHPPLQTSPSTNVYGPSRIDLKYLGEWVDPSFKDSAELGDPRIAYRNVTIVGASGLVRADKFGKSDPYAIVYVLQRQSAQDDEGDWIRIGDTEHVNNSLDPIWKKSNVFRHEISQFYVNGVLQPPEQQMKVRVRICDFDNSENEADDDFLGQVIFETEGNQVVFPRQSLRLEGCADHPSVKVQGEVTVEVSDATESKQPVHRPESQPPPRPEPELEPQLEPETKNEAAMLSHGEDKMVNGNVDIDTSDVTPDDLEDSVGADVGLVPEPEPLRERLESQAYPTQSEIASSVS